jgi:branched-chain amino acid transport system substrate-binding protein
MRTRFFRSSRPFTSLAAVACAMALVVSGCGNRTEDTDAASSAAGVEAPTGTDPALGAGGSDPEAPAESPASETAPAAAPAPSPPTPGSAPTPSATSAGKPSVGAGSAQGTSAKTPAAAGSAAGPKASAQAGGSSPSAPAAAPGSGAPAPVGDCAGKLSPIVLGSVSTMSGLVGETVGGGPKAVQAWVAAINARGGLHCHPVKYLIADDGADPNRHQSLIQQMVERDKVHAFLYNAAPLSGYSSVGYIDKKQIPVIGNEGGSTWFYDSQFFFPQGISGGTPFVNAFFGAATSGAAKDVKKVAAVSCVEAPICSGVYSEAPQAAKKFNVDLVYNAQATLTQPDYTSHCLSAQSAGAQVVLLSIDGNSIHRFGRSCESVGYKPVYVSVVSALRTDFAEDPALEGFIGGVHSLPWFNTANPLMKEFQDVLRKHAAGVAPSPATASGWATAKLFEYATWNISEPPTSQSILEGLWTIQNNDIGGLVEPVTYVKGQPSKELTCFWAPSVQKGRWVGGDRRICP